MARGKNDQNKKSRNNSDNSQNPSPKMALVEIENHQGNRIPVYSPLLNDNWQDGFLVWTCMNIIMGLFPIIVTASFYFLGEYTIDWHVYFIGLVPDFLLLIFTVCANICFYIIGLDETKINATHKQLAFFFPFLLAIGTMIVYAFVFRRVSESDIHISWVTWLFVIFNVVLFLICYKRFYSIWGLLYGDSEQG